MLFGTNNLKNLTEENIFTDADINIICGIVIHAADFHGNAQIFEISKKWSLLVN